MTKSYRWGMAVLLTLVGISMWRGLEEYRQTKRAEVISKEVQSLKEAIATFSKHEGEATEALAKLRQQYLELDDKDSERKRLQELTQQVGNRTLDRKERSEALRERDAILGKITSRQEERRSLEVTIQGHEAGLRATKAVRETNEAKLRELVGNK